LLLRGELFPEDAVAVGFAGEGDRFWVFPAEVADGAGLVGGLADGEVDAVGAPECVFVGDDDDRLCTQFFAIGGDRVWNIGNGDRKVEFSLGHFGKVEEDGAIEPSIELRNGLSLALPCGKM
jgi:hypothetical protein